jgi:membrane protease YdiL (CAAX protease family)
MSQEAGDYYRATRHPRACVLFVLPLLLAYEVGILLLGAHQPEALRNGADTWLRWALSHVGLTQAFWPGVVVAVSLLGWAWWRRDGQPAELPGVCVGIAIESGVFAVCLWGLSQGLARVLSVVHLPLALDNQPEPAMQHLVSFLGAGIYEEVLFRLLLLSLLYQFFQLGDLSSLAAVSLAVTLSALVFAAAHHVGLSGEPFNGAVFLFRTAAGVYFALLVRWRGLGVAVGAHAGYDVLVGVVLPSQWLVVNG